MIPSICLLALDHMWEQGKNTPREATNMSSELQGQNVGESNVTESKLLLHTFSEYQLKSQILQHLLALETDDLPYCCGNL